MRRLLSPIALRLLLFNVLLVFLPVAGLFSLRTLERQLLDLQERSMVQQGRLVAAALSANANGIAAADAAGLIQRLAGRSESRVRVIDRTARVIADSAARGAAVAQIEETYNVDPALRKRVLYRAGALLWRALDAVRGLLGMEPRSSFDSARRDTTPRDVVLKALAGRYGATVRESAGQRSLTIYSALPIQAGGHGEAIGAVLVSQSTSRILQSLWRVRLDLIEIVALSLLVAIGLSLILAATIARPLIRLRDEADALLDHRGRLRGTFGGSKRGDEIGDLTRALERLTSRLERHLAFVEGFTADVSHEFKNPLASIRSAAELLPQTDDALQREQLAATIDKEVARLGRLLNGVREVSRVDTAIDTEVAKPVDVRTILTELGVPLTAPAQPVYVTASEDRLVQALRNIAENAMSFSPHVRASIQEQHGFAVIRIDDEGPGIPPEHLDRIFDRFFTFRPTPDSRNHDGLGLAIARAIIEGYGGTISASNLAGGGARFEVRLPVS